MDVCKMPTDTLGDGVVIRVRLSRVYSPPLARPTSSAGRDGDVFAALEGVGWELGAGRMLNTARPTKKLSSAF